jgi:hypothetical protein
MTRNPVNAIKLTNRRTVKRRKRNAWTVDNARWFLESAWHAGEARYAAFVLILDLRRPGTRAHLGTHRLGAPPSCRVAMRILRHSKNAVTMEIYTEVPSAATREALEQLGQWLDSDR